MCGQAAIDGPLRTASCAYGLLSHHRINHTPLCSQTKAKTLYIKRHAPTNTADGQCMPAASCWLTSIKHHLDSLGPCELLHPFNNILMVV